MTVKEFLGQAYLLDKRIQSDTKELEELQLMRGVISSPGFEEHYNATKNTEAPFIRTIEKICELEQKILEEMSLLMNIKSQIRDSINMVEKPELEMVLRYRYIHNMTWPAIGDKLMADESTVRRWHNKAIAKITVPENAINLKSCTCLHGNARV